MHRQRILFIACICFFGSSLGLVEDQSKTIGKMIKQLNDKKAEKREEAANYLGKVRSLEAVSALSSALKDPEEDVRWAAAYALYQIAPDAKHAIPALKAALKDSNGSVRLNAAAALSKMDVPDAELAPSIRDCCKILIQKCGSKLHPCWSQWMYRLQNCYQQSQTA